MLRLLYTTLIWVKLHLADRKPFYTCSYYRPPDHNINSIVQLNKFFTKLFKREASYPIVLPAGDFNFSDVVWSDGHSLVKPNPSYGHEINDLFLDFINDYNLEQLIHKPTRGKNILYLVSSSHPAFISHVSIIPGISDHDAVLPNFNLKEISQITMYICIRRVTMMVLKII